MARRRERRLLRLSTYARRTFAEARGARTSWVARAREAEAYGLPPAQGFHWTRRFGNLAPVALPPFFALAWLALLVVGLRTR